jgi:hypothetical protein
MLEQKTPDAEVSGTVPAELQHLERSKLDVAEVQLSVRDAEQCAGEGLRGSCAAEEIVSAQSDVRRYSKGPSRGNANMIGGWSVVAPAQLCTRSRPNSESVAPELEGEAVPLIGGIQAVDLDLAVVIMGAESTAKPQTRVDDVAVSSACLYINERTDPIAAW